MRLCADPEVMRFVGPGRPLDRPAAEIAFAVVLAHWDEHGFGLRSVLDGATGVYEGFVGLARVPPAGVVPGEVEIGWRLRRAGWGRGLATEAALAVRDGDAFGALALPSLVAAARPRNRRSLRVMEKLGMRRAGAGPTTHGRPTVIYRLDNPHRLS